MISRPHEHTATLAASLAKAAALANPQAVAPYAYTVPVSPPAPVGPAGYTVPAAAAVQIRISPVNEYIPFAANIGAYVEDQRAWASEPVLQWGFPAGSELPALQANKLWKQSTFIAAGVAQTIADILRVDMLDDGDLPLFVTRLRQAIASIATTAGGGIPEPPPDGRVYGRHWLTTRGLGPHSVTLQQMTQTADWTPVMPVSGGVFTGPVVLAGPAAEPNSPVTKAELDVVAQLARDALPRSGGIMSGPLILARMPEEEMEAVPRLYLDHLGIVQPPTGAIADAPADGGNYVRQSGRWVDTIDCGDYMLDFGPLITRPPTDTVLEAPMDGSCYFRRNGNWANWIDGGADYTITGLAIATRSNAPGLPEAPMDDTSYIRLNEGWTSVLDCGTY